VAWECVHADAITTSNLWNA